MIRVLFVCLGNICRSPLAQGIFESKIRELGLADKIYVDSAGTSGYHEGQKPDAGSIEIARKNSIRIENQKSRPVSRGDQNEFDYFIAMDETNHANLVREFGVPREKIFLMREFDPQPESRNVPDPYGGNSRSFGEVYDIINRSMAPFIHFLREKHKI